MDANIKCSTRWSGLSLLLLALSCGEHDSGGRPGGGGAAAGNSGIGGSGAGSGAVAGIGAGGIGGAPWAGGAAGGGSGGDSGAGGSSGAAGSAGAGGGSSGGSGAGGNGSGGSGAGGNGSGGSGAGGNGGTNGAFKKWHPGLYFRPQGQATQSNQTDYLNKMLAAISGRASELDGTAAEMKGVLVSVAWGVGNPTGSTYDDSQINSILARAEQENKYVLLLVTQKSFLTTSSGYEAPADLAGEIWKTPGGYWAQMHKAANMTRFISYLKHLATVYDNHPRLEGIISVEPTPSFAGGGAPPGYNVGDLAAQWIRMYKEVSPLFVKTSFAPGINHLGGSGASNLTDDLFASAMTEAKGFSSPDTREVDAWHLYDGTDSLATGDHRGKMMRVTTVSQSSWSKTSRTTAQVIDFYQLGKASHVAWIDQAVSNSTGSYTWTQNKAFMLADPSVWTACPTLYSGCL